VNSQSSSSSVIVVGNVNLIAESPSLMIFCGVKVNWKAVYVYTTSESTNSISMSEIGPAVISDESISKPEVYSQRRSLKSSSLAT
jgi:hypothetical protein